MEEGMSNLDWWEKKKAQGTRDKEQGTRDKEQREFIPKDYQRSAIYDLR
jgi:hypothetical protein